MKKVLITGGSGTVGSGFIQEYADQYQFISLSRNLEKQAVLKRKFPQVQLVNASIEDSQGLTKVFREIKPDIVIHAAALKHIEAAEKNPMSAIQVNIMGSLNVIQASKSADAEVTVGISSDKACIRNSVYGQTKYLMERMFLESSTEKSKFICCRLGNVAGSTGSVIPIWINQAKKNQPLQLTDKRMNLFMSPLREIAQLIQKSIITASKENTGFIILKKMKAINLYRLAKIISPEIALIGKRAGEKLNEILVNQDELPFTYQHSDVVLIKSTLNPDENNRMKIELNSEFSEKMELNEIEQLLSEAKEQCYECIT